MIFPLKRVSNGTKDELMNSLCLLCEMRFSTTTFLALIVITTSLLPNKKTYFVLRKKLLNKKTLPQNLYTKKQVSF